MLLNLMIENDPQKIFAQKWIFRDLGPFIDLHKRWVFFVNSGKWLFMLTSVNLQSIYTHSFCFFPSLVCIWTNFVKFGHLRKLARGVATFENGYFNQISKFMLNWVGLTRSCEDLSDQIFVRIDSPRLYQHHPTVRFSQNTIFCRPWPLK